MSFIDKIKSFFGTDDVSNQNSVNESDVLEEITLKNVDRFNQKLEKDLKKIEEKRGHIKTSMTERINRFNLEILENVKIVQEVDIGKIRERENLKILTKKGIDSYIEILDELIKGLDDAKNMPSEEYVNKIVENVNRFSKLSRVHFERATILVGDKMVNLKETCNSLFRDLTGIIKENPKLSKEKEKIVVLQKLVLELKEDKKKVEEYEENKNALNEKIRILRKDREALKKRMDELENSSDYKKDEENKEKAKKDTEKLENEIQLLKKQIDFKALAKVFYKDAKKMNVLKSYSENFLYSVKNDTNLDIIPIVKESTGADLAVLLTIKNKLESLKNMPLSKVDRIKKEIQDDLIHTENSLAEAEVEIVREDKIKSRLGEKESELLLNINEENNALHLLITS
ncbi:MAG: hypothetical protein WCP89_02765 [archaeon]